MLERDLREFRDGIHDTVRVLLLAQQEYNTQRNQCRVKVAAARKEAERDRRDRRTCGALATSRTVFLVIAASIACATATQHITADQIEVQRARQQAENAAVTVAV